VYKIGRVLGQGSFGEVVLAERRSYSSPSSFSSSLLISSLELCDSQVYDPLSELLHVSVKQLFLNPDIAFGVLHRKYLHRRRESLNSRIKLI